MGLSRFCPGYMTLRGVLLFLAIQREITESGIGGQLSLPGPLPWSSTTLVVRGGGGIGTPDYFGNDDTDDSYLHNGRFQKYSGFSIHILLAMNFMDVQTRKHSYFLPCDDCRTRAGMGAKKIRPRTAMSPGSISRGSTA